MTAYSYSDTEVGDTSIFADMSGVSTAANQTLQLAQNPTLLYAAIALTTSGDNTIVTPTSGKSLRIRHIVLIAASSVAVTLKLGSSSITGALTFLQYGDSEIPHLFAGAANEAFKVNLGSSVVVNGFILYYEV